MSMPTYNMSFIFFCFYFCFIDFKLQTWILPRCSWSVPPSDDGPPSPEDSEVLLALIRHIARESKLSEALKAVQRNQGKLFKSHNHTQHKVKIPWGENPQNMKCLSHFSLVLLVLLHSSHVSVIHSPIEMLRIADRCLKLEAKHYFCLRPKHKRMMR